MESNKRKRQFFTILFATADFWRCFYVIDASAYWKCHLMVGLLNAPAEIVRNQGLQKQYHGIIWIADVSQYIYEYICSISINMEFNLEGVSQAYIL